jgi:hypothetical protein
LAVSINNEEEVKMKEIKKQKVLLLFVLFIASTLLIVSVADAAFSIRLEKDAQISELPGGTLPTNVTFEIFDSETATTAIATQTFPALDLVVDLPLNWIPGYNYVLRLKADFTNTGALTMDMDSVESSTVVTGGVTNVMIADDAVTTAKILDNTVSSADAGFNYAGSDSKGGPAIDLDCTGCVSQSELDFTPGDDGDWTISGSNIYSSVSGNVGIGTSTPQSKLDVAGDILLSRTNKNWEVGTTCTGIFCGPGYFYIRDLDDQVLQNRLIIDDITGDVGIAKNLLVVGDGGFNSSGEEGIIYLGDNFNYIKAVHGAGVRIGAFSAPNAVSINNGGNVGIGTTTPGRRLDVNGTTRTEVLEIIGGSDLSEQFEIRKPKTDLLTEPGMVVSIDSEKPGALTLSSKAYDRKVAGIISGAGGIKPGMLMAQEGTIASGANPVALTGRVYAWVDASSGPIEPGDLLTTSNTPGHAMKVADYTKAQGAIIGKAMSSLDQGKGLVLVLVTLQ